MGKKKDILTIGIATEECLEYCYEEVQALLKKMGEHSRSKP